MGHELHAHEPAYQEAFDTCTALFQAEGVNLADLISPSYLPSLNSQPSTLNPAPAPSADLNNTANAQPALFATSYALAKLLLSFGLTPSAMLGHSIGEYVAATLAGVLSLSDAVKLVAARGRLMAAMAPGSMLAVRLPEAELLPFLPATLDLAALNAPGLTVVSGPAEAIGAFTLTLEAAGHSARKLHTSHAFHSSMMEPALAGFRAVLDTVTLHPPQLPYISNLTGQPITEAQATDPDYYVQHIRQAVRFADGIATLCQAGPTLFLEVGPGTALAPLAKQHPAATTSTALALLPSAKDQGANEYHTFLQSLGKAWSHGLTIDWAAFHHHDPRHRLPLPGYAFERQRYCPDTVLPAGTTREGEAWLQLPKREHSREHGAPACEFPSSHPATQNSNATAAAPQSDELETPGPEPRAPFGTPLTRHAHLVSELQTQLHQISGIDTTTADPATPFLDLGFDSLFLTSASNSLKKHFGLKITFRQLMEDQASITDLATWLDEELPPDKFQPPVAENRPYGNHAPCSSSLNPQPSTLNPPQGTADRLALIEQQIHALRTTLTSPHSRSSNPASAAYSVQVKSLKGSDGKKIAFGPFKPIERTKDGSLTPAQQAHLTELIAAYTAKYPKAKAFTADHRDVFADPRAVAGFNLLWKDMVFPAVTDRSEGAYLWDTDGNRWIDVVHGFGLGFFGHRPKFVTDALHAQIDKGFEIGPTSPLAEEVAHLIREFSGQERVAFCNTGSEALMAAIRTSRTISGRNIIAMFAGGYHGIFDEVLARPLVINGELRSIPIAPGIPDLAQASILVLEYDNPESLEILARVGHDIACVLVEPVMSRRPDVVPIDFVQKLRAITRGTGTALVFDEVVLGFRTGPGGAQVHFGIQADLVTYGKVIGGGMPLGVICGQRKYMDALDGGSWQYGDDSMPEVGVTFFAGTFIRHPLTLAAARAVLLKLKEIGPTLQQAVEAKTKDFVDRLNTLFEDAAVPLKSTRFSSMWMLNADPGLKYFGLLYYHLRLRGIHLWEGRPGFLSTAHTAQDVDEILAAFQESTTALQAGGFFPLATGSTGVPPVTPGVPPGAGALVPTLLAAPTTPAQQEMFLASQLSEDAARACHESLSLHLTGPLDTAILTKALQLLVQRHDSLHATFSSDGQLMHFHPEAPLNFREHSLNSQLSTFNSPASDLDALRESEFLIPFDLEAGPLHRFLLVRTGPETAELILTAHHIICDGWSFGVLVHEFPEAWQVAQASSLRGIRASSAEENPPSQLSTLNSQLLPLPAAASYAAYATGQHSDRTSLLFAPDKTYWNQQFKTLPTPLLLPADGPAPTAPGYEAEAAETHLPADLAERLKVFCRTQKITPYHALLTVYQILLHRLSGQSDFLIGMPVAGQPNAGLLDLTGHCVQFLPLRAQLDPVESAAALAQRTRSLTLSAQEHQNITLGEILDNLPGLTGTDRQRFIAATFSLEPAPETITAGPLTGTPVGNPKRRLSFDLSLYVFQGSDGMTIRCAFRRDLFSQDSIQRWLSHFITLTESLIAGPEQEIRRLPLLDEAQRHSLIHGFNAHQISFPDAPCLHHWFEKTAAAHPQRIAVNGSSISLTYEELNTRANRIAHWLIGQGVGPDTLVGLCMSRGPDLLCALLGILKAGGAYLPIDLSYPADRLAFMLEDGGARILLTQKKLAKELPAHSGQTLFLDEAADLLAGQPDTNPVTATAPEHIAYVIYTSGSTGKPKGCMVTHHNVSRLMLATEAWYGFNHEDVWTLFHSSAFDFSVWEIWGALLYGGRLVVVPFLVSRSPDEFYQILSTEKVTVLNQTPSAFRQLVHAESSAPRPLPLALRYVIFGGETLDMQSLQPWFDLHGDTTPQLVNMYGITETTVHVTYRPIRLADTAGGSVIGIPIPDLQLYILDPETREPQPIGVPGEMYVGGDGLARGYLHREELTSERFIPNHLTGTGKLYKTGDLARFVEGSTQGSTGLRPVSFNSSSLSQITASETPGPESRAPFPLDIEYLGRIDHQVKIRGFRIELGEIESALTAHPQIREAAVLARTDHHSDKKLYAYLIPAEKSDPPITADLRAHLLKTLPDYMVPSAFLFLDRFPLTTNGKLDQTALPTPDSTAIITPEDFTPPQTQTQRHIAGLWQNIIGSNHIGVRSDFFASGGTSLNALRLMQQIRQDFSVTLPLGVLFKAPTLGQLSEAVDSARTSPLLRTAGSALTCLQEGPGGTPIFLIHGGDGGALFYRALLPKLGPDASVYIIESPGLTDDTWLLARKNVEATAHHFITLMQTLQSEGPYRIGGYSFGGLVAYEMAQQLRATGETTEHLIMFDTENTGVGVRLLTLPERLAAGWRLGGSDFGSKVKGLTGRVASGLKSRKEVEAETAEARALLNQDKAATGPLRIVQVRDTHVDAMAEYKIRPYPGSMLLLRSTAPSDKYERLPDYGWERMVGSLEIRHVPGNHLQLFDPENADELAQTLREALKV